jgi:hypothetical protein
METNTETTTQVHKFERAGLGKAPFRFVGMIEQDLCYGQAILNRAEYEKTGIMVTTAPGGSCDYCGQYIVHMFQIKSADGKTFKVGSDCVAKTGDVGLVRRVKKIVSERTAAARKARDAQKITDGIAMLARPEVQALLASRPSPNTYRAEKGETLADHVAWFMKNAGTSGRLHTIKQVTKILEESAK